MKFKVFNISALLLLSVLTLTACGHAGSERQLKQEVDSFAVNYFNWEFPKALPYCTPESQRWLRYAASQVHQADIDLLRSKAEGASCTLGEVEYDDEVDSLATIPVTVTDFLAMDTIGQAAHPEDEAVFRLSVVLRAGKWKVRMEGLPRSEKRSLD